MINFTDRVPVKLNRRQITYDDGSSVYAVITNADEAVTEGTLINRKNLMAVQGFEASSAAFVNDRDIKYVYYSDSSALEVTFEADKIIETFTGKDGKVITKTISFNFDGTGIGVAIS